MGVVVGAVKTTEDALIQHIPVAASTSWAAIVSPVEADSALPSITLEEGLGLQSVGQGALLVPRHAICSAPGYMGADQTQCL